MGEVLDVIVGLGEDGHSLSSWQMIVRAAFVYAFAVLLIRVGDKRFLGQSTAFDVILGVVLGSILSRAITGNSAFIPTIGAAVALVALHWGLAFVSFRSDRFGSLVKGTPRRLVVNGEIQADVVARSHISEQDLLQALRSN